MPMRPAPAYLCHRRPAAAHGWAPAPAAASPGPQQGGV